MNGHVVVATNPTVSELYAADFAAGLRNAQVITMEDGEEFKSLETVESAYHQLLELGADRSTTIVRDGWWCGG